MRRTFMAVVASCAAVSGTVITLAEAESPKPLVVHEWGTFTVLQDDPGNPVDGVNINEESLPPFVHRLAPDLTPDSHELAPLTGLGYSRRPGSKGIQRYYHAARMRMETPIIYLYPPNDQPKNPVTVDVDFKGGWITEWYPNAKVDAPGFRQRDARLMMSLKPSTTGNITWNDVQTTKEAQPPATDFPVWVAPRKTAAPRLTTPAGESENYLFYRGVANLEAPLRVIRNGETLTIHVNDKSTCPINDFSRLELWLVNVNSDGDLLYRTIALRNAAPQPGQAIASTSTVFEQRAGRGLPALRAEMLASLVHRGLYNDEAEAMLNTWEASYFRTEGLRLFFTLPQAWTDRVLPMNVTGYEKTETVRTMIGRIELISARQRKLLRQIAQGPVSNRGWFTEWLRANQPESNAAVYRLQQGTTTFDEIGLQPTDDYQAYMDLGRFRDALIRHAIRYPVNSAKQSECVHVSGPVIKVRPPSAQTTKCDSIVISLPGDNRIINLGEMELYSGSRNVTQLASLSQSSNYQNRFPARNLVDGNTSSLSHTNPETNPWIRVEFAHPLPIDEMTIWNRDDSDGRFAGRFDGAEVAFFNGEQNVGSVKIHIVDSSNLRTFASNYGLPGRQLWNQ